MVAIKKLNRRHSNINYSYHFKLRQIVVYLTSYITNELTKYMIHFFNDFLRLKTIVFVSCALSLSSVAMAQTINTNQPAKTTVSDDDMDSDSTSAIDTQCTCVNKNDNKFIVIADFGGSDIYSNSNGTSTSAPGLTWGVSGQLAHQFKVKSKHTRLYLSAGLEVRNFNGTLSTSDGIGSTEYDNYHFWYAGIPVMLQVVDVKHKTGHKNDIGYYAQAGVTFGFKFDMLDVNSIQGNNTWTDVNDNYTTVMLNGHISAGIAYKTKHNTYLLGPYVGYVATNISKVDGVTQNILSYGARLTLLLFK